LNQGILKRAGEKLEQGDLVYVKRTRVWKFMGEHSDNQILGVAMHDVKVGEPVDVIIKGSVPNFD